MRFGANLHAIMRNNYNAQLLGIANSRAYISAYLCKDFQGLVVFYVNIISRVLQLTKQFA